MLLFIVLEAIGNINNFSVKVRDVFNFCEYGLHTKLCTCTQGGIIRNLYRKQVGLEISHASEA
jgi:hypothetical protein